MTGIVFVPICSECGSQIPGPVGTEPNNYTDIEYRNEYILPNICSPFISPRRCPTCGSEFEKIIAPDQELLFSGNNVDMLEALNILRRRNEF